jgi:hypothetical protein
MMFVFPPIAPRVAFFCLSAVLLGAAVPLAWAWTLLLPRDPEPFAAPPEMENVSSAARTKQNRRDPIAAVLLVFVTLSYAQQFPGVPEDIATVWIAKIVPASAAGWSALALHWFFILIPGVAAIYALFTRNSLRIPLVAASLMVLLVWLLAPPLYAALLAPPLYAALLAPPLYAALLASS